MKRKGFTIIELMVAATIIAMLSAMAGQTFRNSKNLQFFESDIKNVFLKILDARTNAITEKKCANGDTGKSWNLKINLSGIILSCGGIEQESQSFSEALLINSIEFPPTIGLQTNVQFEFLPGSAQLRILNELGGTLYSKKKTKIVFRHVSFPDEERTLCVDRIAGFPRLEVGNVTCF